MEASITQLGLNNYLINKKEKAVSFFKHNYNNYTNFVKDTRRLNFKNNVNFGGKAVFRLDEDANYGDLITNIVLEVDLPDITNLKSDTSNESMSYCNGIGNALLKNVSLKIGGNLIDEHDSIWMDIWSQLSIPRGKQDNYQNIIKKSKNFDTAVPFYQGGKIYIPLLFWFCQNTNYNSNPLALPIVSLRNNVMELILEFNQFNELLTCPSFEKPSSQLKLENVQLLIDFVILEEKERVNYLENPRQMHLISQVQSQNYDIPATTQNINISLKSFKYPITELFFVFRRNDALSTNKEFFNYSNVLNQETSSSPIKKVKLSFDGRDRLPELDSSYFTQVEPSKVHDNIPVNTHIHCYSFALQPENMAQPTGSCNFSEIHEPILHLEFINGLGAGILYVYALNYNVLQIDNSGNAWLLHNLSKSAPIKLPDKNSKLPGDC